MSAEQKSDLIKLGALWKPKNENSKVFLTGELNQNTALLIFENGHKDKPSQPDYIVYAAKKQPRDNDNQSASESSNDDNMPF